MLFRSNVWMNDRECDACFMANVSYQLSPSKGAQALRNINNSLKPGGWLLTADYENGGSKRRPFTYEISGRKKIEEGVFSETITLFLLDSGDCKQIAVPQRAPLLLTDTQVVSEW